MYTYSIDVYQQWYIYIYTHTYTIYIYIYICIYIWCDVWYDNDVLWCDVMWCDRGRTRSSTTSRSTGTTCSRATARRLAKRVTWERGTGSGFLPKSTGANGENGFPQKPTGYLFCFYRNLQNGSKNRGGFFCLLLPGLASIWSRSSCLEANDEEQQLRGSHLSNATVLV